MGVTGSASDRMGVLTVSGRRVLAAAVFATGASALVLQVTWHRVLTLHAGIDLAASTTVVTAFLAGLGLGNLLGGRLADRVSPRGALRAMAAADVGVAIYALVSISLLYDLYRSIVSEVSSLAATFGFNVVVLLPPTLLFGLTLPLIARVVTGTIGDAGRLVGRFNAINTIGAAYGALFGGWFLLGTFGYVAVTRLSATVHLVSATALLALSTQRCFAGTVSETKPANQMPQETASPDEAASAGSTSTIQQASPPQNRPTKWPADRWYLVYGLTGALALGFEQVFFRLIDGVLRSNAYTFSHVLGLYLLLWSGGAAVGSILVTRVHDQRRAFLWMAWAIGVGALGSLVALVRLVPVSPFSGIFESWFTSPGLAFGLEPPSHFWAFGVALPMAIMGVPVLLFGAMFPFAEALASRDLPHLGRTTGRLVAASLVGNVAGAVLTSFVLIEHLGTAGALLVLSIPLLGAGLIAAGYAPSHRAAPQRVFVVLSAVVLVLVVPSNQRLWASLLADTPENLVVAEDRACASMIRVAGDSAEFAGLVINGRNQNGFPFDDFHVLLGLLPALVHPDPNDALVVGFGIGSTSYAMLASERLESVTSVEICPGNFELSAEMARRGAPEFLRLEEDPSHKTVVNDGRKLLLSTDEHFDLIVPDTLVQTWAGSNNVYSLEFFELAAERLAPDGIMAIWSPTPRVAAAATSTFPYVVRVDGPTEEVPPQIVFASHAPLDLDPDQLLRRFDEIPPDAVPPGQRQSLWALIGNLETECLNNGSVSPASDPSLVNRDLQPRDEYFLNGSGMADESIPRSC